MIKVLFFPLEIKCTCNEMDKSCLIQWILTNYIYETQAIIKITFSPQKIPSCFFPINSCFPLPVPWATIVPYDFPTSYISFCFSSCMLVCVRLLSSLYIWDSCMWCVNSFLWLSSISLYRYAVVYPFSCWWTTGPFPVSRYK